MSAPSRSVSWSVPSGSAEYVRRFGFGRSVSPDFPGESPGIVWDPTKWTDSALASVSMGYQVGVTPLQMVTAVSAVANGGELVEPRAIRAVYDGNRRYHVQPKVVRRSIAGDTAALLTSIMEGVVERGTARAAQIPGYTIAGKTGTAAKLVNGRYSKSEYNASFVGFLPSRDPAVAIIVVIDSPHARHVFRRLGGGADLQTHRGVDAALSRHRPDAEPGVAGHRRAPRRGVRHADGRARDGRPGRQLRHRWFRGDDARSERDERAPSHAHAGDRRSHRANLRRRCSRCRRTRPPGTALDAGGVSRITLERSPARHLSSATQP